MTQLLYGLMALVVVMLFTIFITSAGLTGEQEMYLTEARTRMLGVARETVERLTTLELPFDYATDPDRGASGQTFPYVNSAAQLTAGDSLFRWMQPRKRRGAQYMPRH
ncbi:MAG TPA: hypothetical protein VMO47_07585 [Rhodothermales bacterium]|nr:hypothetical protein [Rhodothermales bacterium]